MARIIVESGKARGQKYALPERSIVVKIGRDPSCAISLPDALVSRLHCVLRPWRGDWLIEDRKSRNGTYVNDSPVTEKVLESGDSVRVGETLLSFLVEQEDPLIGQTLGVYRVERRLGRGATGTVYRATQTTLDRTVALKVLSATLASNDDFVKSFLEEARAAARLNHPNVVQVYDAGQDGERYFISLEYLPGGSLEEILAAKGRLPFESAVDVAIDACRALAFAESHQIVHRDIKPANLLIAEDETVKVGDLGIAADLRIPGSESSRRTAGSPRYMAPEQALGDAVDHRADIYALGSSLYRLISGAYPFDGATLREIIWAKLESDPRPLREIMPEVPEPLDRVVQKMMARHPEERFASASAVEGALRAAVAPQINAPRRRQRLARRPRPRSRGALLPVLLLLGALLVALGFALWRGGDADEAPTNEAIERLKWELEARRGAPSSVSPPPKKEKSGDAEAREMRRELIAKALREVATTQASLREGEIGADDAEARADLVIRTFPDDPEIQSRVVELRRSIREAKDKARSEVADRIRAEIEALIVQGDLKAADRSLVDLAAQPDHDEELLASLRKFLDESLTDRLQSGRRRIEDLIETKRFAEAGREIERLRADLPDVYAETVAELQALNDKAAKLHAELMRRVATGASAVRGAISRLAFDQAMAEWRNTFTGEEDLMASSLLLRREVELTREVWTHILESLRSRIEAKDPVHWRLPSSEPGERADPVVCHIIAQEGPTVTVQEEGARSSRIVAILELPDDDLLSMLAPVGSPPSPEMLRGLGLLLLYRRGPERAQPILERSAVDAEERLQLKELVESEASRWLEARLALLDQLLESATTADGARASPDVWSYLSREARSAILATLGDTTREPARERLGELFVRSRSRTILQEPQESFFHAKTVSFPSRGVVSLVYDFTSDEQLADFRPVPAPSSAASPFTRKAPDRAVLRGEVRLLEGDPFVEKIGVGGWIPAGGYTGANPGIHLALFTDEGTAVTPDLTAVQNAPSAGGGALEYVVLGHGYLLSREWAALENRFRAPSGSSAASFFKYLRGPCFVLFAGYADLPLHADPTRELIWQEPSGSRLVGAVNYAAVMENGQLKWSVKGHSLAVRKSPRYDVLQTGAPHRGSVTFFSQGQSVTYSRIEIMGQLEPDWFQDMAIRRAARELEQLLSTTPPRPPVDRQAPSPSPTVSPDPSSSEDAPASSAVQLEPAYSFSPGRPS